MRSTISGTLISCAMVTGLLVQDRSLVAQDLLSKLQNKLEMTIEKHSFPGATMGIVLPDGKSISLAAGFEDPQKPSPMKRNSRMFCGSTGKTFVSAVVLQLAEKGRLKLDDQVKSYFDAKMDAWFFELPQANSITIRNLLNHTSGLPRYIFQPAFLKDLTKNPLAPRSPQECLSFLRNTQPRHVVGKGWFYSDSNYLLLGLIIERVTRQSFYENVSNRILRPLQLTDTIPATQPKIDGLIQGHIGRVNPFGLPAKTVSDSGYALNPKFEWCGGGFVTTSKDLSIWMKALHSDKVLKPNSYKQLIKSAPFKTDLSGNAGYGLGTFVWDTPDGKYYGHAGVMPGYLTQIEFSARHRFAIAFQTNTDEGFGRHHHEIVQSFAKLLIQHLQEDGQ